MHTWPGHVDMSPMQLYRALHVEWACTQNAYMLAFMFYSQCLESLNTFKAVLETGASQLLTHERQANEMHVHQQHLKMSPFINEQQSPVIKTQPVG